MSKEIIDTIRRGISMRALIQLGIAALIYALILAYDRSEIISLSHNDAIGNLSASILFGACILVSSLMPYIQWILFGPLNDHLCTKAVFGYQKTKRSIFDEAQEFPTFVHFTSVKKYFAYLTQSAILSTRFPRARRILGINKRNFIFFALEIDLLLGESLFTRSEEDIMGYLFLSCSLIFPLFIPPTIMLASSAPFAIFLSLIIAILSIISFLGGVMITLLHYLLIYKKSIEALSQRSRRELLARKKNGRPVHRTFITYLENRKLRKASKPTRTSVESQNRSPAELLEE